MTVLDLSRMYFFLTRGAVFVDYCGIVYQKCKLIQIKMKPM